MAPTATRPRKAASARTATSRPGKAASGRLRKTAAPDIDLRDQPAEPATNPDFLGGQVHLAPIGMVTAHVPIVGETPLIPHKWSEKAKRMMFEKQSGVAARPKHDPKDPVTEAENATYRLLDGRPGMPATAFKAAIVDGVRLFDGITMVQARQWVRVYGEPDDAGTPLVPIDGKFVLREDTPRNNSGVADLRYRYMYWPWSATIAITFPERYIDVDSIVRLVNAGGLAGVGDWRPSAPKSKTGTFGCFYVNQDKSIRLQRTER